MNQKCKTQKHTHPLKVLNQGSKGDGKIQLFSSSTIASAHRHHGSKVSWKHHLGKKIGGGLACELEDASKNCSPQLRLIKRNILHLIVISREEEVNGVTRSKH